MILGRADHDADAWPARRSCRTLLLVSTAEPAGAPLTDPRPALAHQMAVDRLAAQRASLDELRGRVGTVLSGASIATGFLAGQALNTAHGIPGPAWAAIVFAVALIATSAFILWPRDWAGQRGQAEAVLEDIQNAPHRDPATYLRYLAGYAATAADENDPKLTLLYRVFSVSLVLMVLDFGGWIWTLATNNGR